jgi:hypothetical protein
MIGTKTLNKVVNNTILLKDYSRDFDKNEDNSFRLKKEERENYDLQ